ncbi:hypothetical protein KZX06_04765 [Micrococcus sp. EYE_162]|uniref:hypothetical protein n=1 Tax=unclassified Micrococcus TaxID=2620948 RepID=UPI0020049874|nr:MULTISPECIES: hypothetical protein [unclassified Micrococcus]MCK6095374.1 hypothetical protein [Micrococcus sp. EYE_212]MCK6171354.1 hypothetical protein [Micrococcus sp. EYE_162]
MRTALKRASTAFAGLALAGSLAAPAQAATGWEHTGYAGRSIGGNSLPNVGSLNDQISSVKTYGSKTRFWEDAGYLGRSFTTTDDWSDLRVYTIRIGLTWNDRISSWQRV